MSLSSDVLVKLVPNVIELRESIKKLTAHVDNAEFKNWDAKERIPVLQLLNDMMDTVIAYEYRVNLLIKDCMQRKDFNTAYKLAIANIESGCETTVAKSSLPDIECELGIYDPGPDSD